MAEEMLDRLRHMAGARPNFARSPLTSITPWEISLALSLKGCVCRRRARPALLGLSCQFCRRQSPKKYDARANYTSPCKVAEPRAPRKLSDLFVIS